MGHAWTKLVRLLLGVLALSRSGAGIARLLQIALIRVLQGRAFTTFTILCIDGAAAARTAARAGAPNVGFGLGEPPRVLLADLRIGWRVHPLPIDSDGEPGLPTTLCLDRGPAQAAPRCRSAPAAIPRSLIRSVGVDRSGGLFVRPLSADFAPYSMPQTSEPSAM